MAVLALYWETQYGKALIDSDQVNEIRLLYSRIHLLEAQFSKARDIVIGLRRMHTDTANEAYFEELPAIANFELDTYAPSRYAAERKQLQAHAA